MHNKAQVQLCLFVLHSSPSQKGFKSVASDTYFTFQALGRIYFSQEASLDLHRLFPFSSKIVAHQSVCS